MLGYQVGAYYALKKEINTKIICESDERYIPIFCLITVCILITCNKQSQSKSNMLILMSSDEQTGNFGCPDLLVMVRTLNNLIRVGIPTFVLKSSFVRSEVRNSMKFNFDSSSINQQMNHNNWVFNFLHFIQFSPSVFRRIFVRYHIKHSYYEVFIY